MRRRSGWLGSIALAVGLACSHGTTSSNLADSAGSDARGTAGGSPRSDGGSSGRGVGTAEEAGGPVALEGVVNARHLGTLKSSSGKSLRPKVLIRSGDLSQITSQGCEALAEADVRSILDLRDEPDLGNSPEAACALSGRSYLQFSLPKLLPPSSGIYLDTLDAIEPKLSELFTKVANAESNLLLHCVIGRDRANLVTALLLLAVGISQADVVKDFQENQDASITVEATWLDGVLGRIRDAGGIEAYLESHGVTEAQRTALSERLLQ